MTDTEKKTQYTVDEWRAEAARRFGPVEEGHWSFVCPACGHVQSPASIKASGYGNPNHAYSVCYGRGTRKDLGDCDWKSYGLFHGPVIVTFPDGEKGYTFDFAPTKAEVPPGFVIPLGRATTDQRGTTAQEVDNAD